MIQIPKCKKFSGYRPCEPYKICEAISDSCSPFDSQWLLLAPEKNAPLLQDAELLRKIEASHPRTQIVAVVHPDDLREATAHPLIDLAFPANFETVCILNVMKFDRIIAAEEGPLTHALLARLNKPRDAEGAQDRGFVLADGNIVDLPPPDMSKGPVPRILIINLDALGDVLMTTSFLTAVKRRRPQSTIDWLTEPYAVEVLRHNPHLDNIIPFREESIPLVLGRRYDLVCSVDKGRRSCAVTEMTSSPDKRGYGMNEFGQITCINAEAQYAYRLGIDDHEKFRVNRKTGQQLLAESMDTEYRRDPYILVLMEDEKKFVAAYRAEHAITADTPAIGINTGCSDIYPNKKLTIEKHVALIKKIGDLAKNAVILLLGGRQETQRNAEIAAKCAANGVNCRVIQTPTTEGLRRGILYIAACDVMITGDTSALHIGIALGLYTISWYGVSCWNEIDVYDRGMKFYREDLACSPCWKSECRNMNASAGLPECLAGLDLDKMASAAVFREIVRTRM